MPLPLRFLMLVFLVVIAAGSLVLIRHELRREMQAAAIEPTPSTVATTAEEPTEPPAPSGPGAERQVTANDAVEAAGRESIEDLPPEETAAVPGPEEPGAGEAASDEVLPDAARVAEEPAEPAATPTPASESETVGAETAADTEGAGPQALPPAETETAADAEAEPGADQPPAATLKEEPATATDFAAAQPQSAPEFAEPEVDAPASAETATTATGPHERAPPPTPIAPDEAGPVATGAPQAVEQSVAPRAPEAVTAEEPAYSGTEMAAAEPEPETGIAGAPRDPAEAGGGEMAAVEPAPVPEVAEATPSESAEADEGEMATAAPESPPAEATATVEKSEPEAAEVTSSTDSKLAALEAAPAPEEPRLDEAETFVAEEETAPAESRETDGPAASGPRDEPEPAAGEAAPTIEPQRGARKPGAEAAGETPDAVAAEHYEPADAEIAHEVPGAPEAEVAASGPEVAVTDEPAPSAPVAEEPETRATEQAPPPETATAAAEPHEEGPVAPEAEAADTEEQSLPDAEIAVTEPAGPDRSETSAVPAPEVAEEPATKDVPEPAVAEEPSPAGTGLAAHKSAPVEQGLAAADAPAEEEVELPPDERLRPPAAPGDGNGRPAAEAEPDRNTTVVEKTAPADHAVEGAADSTAAAAVDAEGETAPDAVEPDVASAPKADDTVTPPAAADRAAEGAEVEVAALPQDAPEPPSPPAFDIVRVEPSGETVIAGRGTPHAEVEITANDRVIATVVADPSGEWVAVPQAPLPPGSHEITARARLAGSEAVGSEDRIAVAVPEKPDGGLLVIRSRPDAASEVLDRDDGPAAETAVDAALPEVTDVADAPVIETVEADDGRLYVAGTGAPGSTIRVYAENDYAGETGVDDYGRWYLQTEAAVGSDAVTVRADQVDPDGQVLARAEVPFQRPGGGLVAAAESATEPAEESDTTAPAEGSAEPPTIRIRRGDNLWTIARRTYGRGIRYTVIYEANADQIRDPHWIYPGQVFELPEIGRTDVN